MSGPIAAALSVLKHEGPAGLGARAAGHLWTEFIRPTLPRRSGVAKFNGVLVPCEDGRIGDRVVGVPNYESALCAAIRQVVERGDEVTIVGGGRGVSGVIAARRSQTGRVTIYEASEERFEALPTILELNDVEADLWNERVSAEGDVVGTPGGTARPGELPTPDVLVLDCEGAETRILEGLPSRPRAVVVEYHGHKGAPYDDVLDVLDGRGYEVVRHEPMFHNREMGVLTAVSSD